MMRLHGLPATMSTAGLSEKEVKSLVADGIFLPQWGAVLQAVWLDPEAPWWQPAAKQPEVASLDAPGAGPAGATLRSPAPAPADDAGTAGRMMCVKSRPPPPPPGLAKAHEAAPLESSDDEDLSRPRAEFAQLALNSPSTRAAGAPAPQQGGATGTMAMAQARPTAAEGTGSAATAMAKSAAAPLVPGHNGPGSPPGSRGSSPSHSGAEWDVEVPSEESDDFWRQPAPPLAPEGSDSDAQAPEEEAA